eukprot:gene1347-biopygen13841
MSGCRSRDCNVEGPCWHRNGIHVGIWPRSLARREARAGPRSLARRAARAGPRSLARRAARAGPRSLARRAARAGPRSLARRAARAQRIPKTRLQFRGGCNAPILLLCNPHMGLSDVLSATCAACVQHFKDHLNSARRAVSASGWLVRGCSLRGDTRSGEPIYIHKNEVWDAAEVSCPPPAARGGGSRGSVCGV